MCENKTQSYRKEKNGNTKGEPDNHGDRTKRDKTGMGT